MQISMNQHQAEFRPWRPEDGRVFNSFYALDSETTKIDEQNTWITPAYVLGAVFDGRQGYFLQRQHAAAFFVTHTNLPAIMHNAPFDLAVLDLLAPDLNVYDGVERDQVWDTQLLHRLLMLGTEGHTARGIGKSTLEHCAAHYLGINLPKSLTDSDGHDVRTSYGKWLNRPPGEIESVYLEYLAKDAMVTYLVGVAQAPGCDSFWRRVPASGGVFRRNG